MAFSARGGALPGQRQAMTNARPTVSRSNKTEDKHQQLAAAVVIEHELLLPIGRVIGVIQKL